VPKTHDDDCLALDFIAKLVVAHEQAADLAWGETLQAWIKARIASQQARWGCPQGPHGARRGL